MSLELETATRGLEVGSREWQLVVALVEAAHLLESAAAQPGQSYSWRMAHMEWKERQRIMLLEASHDR